MGIKLASETKNVWLLTGKYSEEEKRDCALELILVQYKNMKVYNHN